MIKLDHVTFAYEETPVLKEISVNLSAGDFCAVIGPNGSGKTTLLKTIAGLLSPQKGYISVDNKEVKAYSPLELARKVAYVSQRQDIVFDFTVFDTVMMGRNPYQSRWEFSTDSDEKIVSEVLEICHLTHLKDRLLYNLSGGEMQRAMIARAMAQQTPVMLLDEPLANLDINHKFEIMDILAGLNRDRKVIILLVIHDFSFALQYASDVILLKENTLRYYGAAKEVLTPQIIKELFELGDEFSVDKAGNVSKMNIFA